MSVLGHTLPVRAVALVALLMMVGVLLTAMVRPPAREVTLVARDMAFYLDGDPGAPNPTIEVRPGERIRIVLRNQDRGMVHDVAIPALHAAGRLIGWNQEADLVFTAPAIPGMYEYVCTPHSLMMRGVVLVSGDHPAETRER